MMRGNDKKVTAPANLIPSELHKFHKGGDARPFLADVDIVCNGGYIPVHSAVLMAGCPMLKEFFTSERGSHNDPITIHLLDYSIDDVTAVVVLFYTGFCVVQSRDQMEQVYEILDHLGIRECTTPSIASSEESKKKNFIRRYLVCEDEDDDDMLIEDEEIIAVDDHDGEADDTPPNVKQPVPPGPPPSVTVERVDVDKEGLKDKASEGVKDKTSEGVKDKTSKQPDGIESQGVSSKTDEGRASDRKKPEESAKAHTSTTFKVPKVNRDGVKGVKTPVVQNKIKDSESDSSNESIKDSKSAKSKKLSKTKETTTKRKASRESPKVSPKRLKRSKASKEDDESEFEAGSHEEDDDDEDEAPSESECESVSSESSTNQKEDGSEDDSSPVPLRKNLRSRPKPKEDSPVFKRLRKRNWKKIKYDDDDDDDDDDEENVQNIESSKGQVVHETNKSESTSRRSKSARGDSSSKESPSKSASKRSKSTGGRSRESPSKNDKKSKSIPSKGKSSDPSKGRRRKDTNDVEYPSDEVESAECVSLKELSVLLTRLSSDEILKQTRRRSSNSSDGTVRSVSSERELENGPSRNSSDNDASNVSVNNNEQQVPHTSQVQRPSSPTPKSLSGDTSGPPPEVVSIQTTSESTALPSTSSASRASVDSDTSRPTAELTMERMQRNIRKWSDCVLKCDACPSSHSCYLDSAQCLERRGSYRCWLCLGIFVTSVTTYEDHCLDVHVYGKPGLGRCPICHVYIDVNSAQNHIIETHLAPAMGEQLQESAVSTDEPLNESQENSQEGLIRIIPLNQITDPEDEEQTEEYSESGPQSGSTDQLHSSLTVTLSQSGSQLSGGSLTSSRQATAQSQGGLMTGSQIATGSLAENVSAIVISHGEKDRNEMVRIQVRRPSSHGQVTVASASTSSNSTTSVPPLGQGQTMGSGQSARPMTTTSALFSNGTSRAGQTQVASRAQTPAPVSYSTTVGQTLTVSRAPIPAPISPSTTTGQALTVSRAQTPAPISHSTTTAQTQAVSRAQPPAPISQSTTTSQAQAASRLQTSAPISQSTTTSQAQAASRLQTSAPISHSTTTSQAQAASRLQTSAPISHTSTNETAYEIANAIKNQLKNRQQLTSRPTSSNTAFSQPQTAVRHPSTTQAGYHRAIRPTTPTSNLTHSDARMTTMTTVGGSPNNKFTLSSGACPRPIPPQSSASNQSLVPYPSHHQQRIPPASQYRVPSTSREHSGNPPGGLATLHLQGPSGPTPANNSPGFLAEIGGVPFRVFKRGNQNDPHSVPELTAFGEQNNPNSYTQSSMRAIENFQPIANEVETMALNQGQLPVVQGSSIGAPEYRPASVMPPPPPAHTSPGMLVSQPQQPARQIPGGSRPSIPGPVGPFSTSGVVRCVHCAMNFNSQAHLNSHICLED